MRVVPLTLAQARDYIAEHHRHHPPPVGHRFSVGLENADGELIGVAVAGRPSARKTDQYRTLEITRLCTDGTRNACSMLYGAVRKAAQAMGFDRIVTFTMPSEGGASLRGVGFTLDGSTPGREWSVPSRNRKAAAHPTGEKWRWVANLRPDAGGEGE